MNRKIGAVSSIVNLLAVLGFAASMLLRFPFGSYLCSMCIAFSFVPMMCCFLHFTAPERKAAGYAAAAFAGAYAAIILLVYFTQRTTVRFGGLTEQARTLLDFQQMNLFFSFDLLGYALMALATFFAGLTICPRSSADKWLRALLLIHGVFFISCLLLPDAGHLSSRQPCVDRCSGAGVLVRLFLSGGDFIVSALSKRGGACKGGRILSAPRPLPSRGFAFVDRNRKRIIIASKLVVCAVPRRGIYGLSPF